MRHRKRLNYRTSSASSRVNSLLFCFFISISIFFRRFGNHELSPTDPPDYDLQQASQQVVVAPFLYIYNKVIYFLPPRTHPIDDIQAEGPTKRIFQRSVSEPRKGKMPIHLIYVMNAVPIRISQYHSLVYYIRTGTLIAALSVRRRTHQYGTWPGRLRTRR